MFFNIDTNNNLPVFFTDFNKLGKLEEIDSNLVELTKKIIQVAKVVFDLLKQAILFPARYLGSKTWSLPGVVLGLPVTLYNKLMGIKTESSNYHYGITHKINPDEARGYLKSTAVAVASFENDPSWLNGLDLNVHTFDGSLDLSAIPGNLQIKNNRIIDLGSGLKVFIVESETEVFFAFGAKHSLSVEVDDNQSRSEILKQQDSNILQNLVGLKPEVYEQAYLVFEQIKNSGIFSNKKVTLTGQCYGGSLAAYVALKSNTMAECYNPLPLGAGIQHQLGDLLNRAEELITNISAEGDFASNLFGTSMLDRVCSFIGIKIPGVFGKRFSIPSAYSDPIGTHAFFLGSLMKHLGYTVRTKPQEVINCEGLINAQITYVDKNKEKIIEFEKVKDTLIDLIKYTYDSDPDHPANILPSSELHERTDNDLVRLFTQIAYLKNIKIFPPIPHLEKLRHAYLTVRESLIRRAVHEQKVTIVKSIIQSIALENESSIQLDIEGVIRDIDSQLGNNVPFHRLVEKSTETGMASLKQAKLPNEEDLRPEAPKSKTRVLHASLEYRRGVVGGLGSVTQSLLPKQNEYGNDSRIVTPFFDFYHSHFPDPKFVGFVKHEFKGKMVESAIYKVRNGDVSGQKGVSHYLVAPTLCYRNLFDVGTAGDLYKNYDHSGGSDRLLYFSSAVAAMAGTYKGRKQKKSFDVLHLHGWHVGAASLLMNTHYNPMRPEDKQIKTVFNVHLATEQGIHLPWAYKAIGLQHESLAPYVNIHADAMLASNYILHVSKEAAKESLTREEGCGLDKLSIQKHEARQLSGVTNGITHREFDPTQDSFGRFKIEIGPDTDYVAAKEKVKSYLHEQGIIKDPKKPLFLFVGRYSSEKGIDMLEGMIEEVRLQGGQCVIMGIKTQDPLMARILARIQATSEHPENFVKFSSDLTFQTAMLDGVKVGNLIRLATDVVMVPSYEESCGLVPMESFSLGAMVVTSQVHGLKDTCFAVGDQDPQDPTKTMTSEDFNSFVYRNGWGRGRRSRKAIASAIEFINADEGRRNRTIGRLIESSKRYDWLTDEGAIPQIEKIYQEIQGGNIAKP